MGSCVCSPTSSIYMACLNEVPYLISKLNDPRRGGHVVIEGGDRQLCVLYGKWCRGAICSWLYSGMRGFVSVFVC